MEGTLYLTTAESFQSHEAFARIYQMLRYKGSVNIFQVTEITQNMFSNHNAIQLVINKNTKLN